MSVPMRFEYKKIGNFLRPVIPIELEHDAFKLKYEVLIDSGADMNIMPSDIGEALNIDVSSGRRAEVGGITPGERSPYYVHSVAMRVGGWAYTDIEVGFMPDMPAYGYGVVGQRGFFDLFKVIFDLRKEEIEIRPYS